MDNYMRLATTCLIDIEQLNDDYSFVNRMAQVYRALLRGYIARSGGIVVPTASVRTLWRSVSKLLHTDSDVLIRAIVLMDKLDKDAHNQRTFVILDKQRQLLHNGVDLLFDLYQT